MSDSLSDNRATVTGAVVKMERVPREVRVRRAKAELRQQVWEASQHLALSDIHRLVEAVLDEIRDDQP